MFYLFSFFMFFVNTSFSVDKKTQTIINEFHVMLKTKLKEKQIKEEKEVDNFTEFFRENLWKKMNTNWNISSPSKYNIGLLTDIYQRNKDILSQIDYTNILHFLEKELSQKIDDIESPWGIGSNMEHTWSNRFESIDNESKLFYLKRLFKRNNMFIDNEDLKQYISNSIENQQYLEKIIQDEKNKYLKISNDFKKQE